MRTVEQRLTDLERRLRKLYEEIYPPVESYKGKRKKDGTLDVDWEHPEIDGNDEYKNA